MHPVITEAAAAERRQDMLSHAAAWRRAREGRSRRTQQARRAWLFMRIPLRAPGTA